MTETREAKSSAVVPVLHPLPLFLLGILLLVTEVDLAPALRLLIDSPPHSL